MTAPVVMTLEDSLKMMFMVPKGLKREMLPKPNQKEIKFRKEPSKIFAVIGFGGWSNDRKIKKFKNQLKQALVQIGLLYKIQFYFFGYNAPYEFFNRKNEIAVELK